MFPSRRWNEEVDYDTRKKRKISGREKARWMPCGRASTLDRDKITHATRRIAQADYTIAQRMFDYNKSQPCWSRSDETNFRDKTTSRLQQGSKEIREPKRRRKGMVYTEHTSTRQKSQIEDAGSERATPDILNSIIHDNQTKQPSPKSVHVKHMIPEKRAKPISSSGANSLRNLLPLSLEHRLQKPESPRTSLHLSLDGIEPQLSIRPQRHSHVAGVLSYTQEPALRRPVRRAFDAQLGEDAVESSDQVVAVLLDVAGRGRDPQPLLAHGHGGVVDGLHVNVPFLEEQVRGLFRSLGVAHQDGDDVGWVRDHGNVLCAQGFLCRASVELLQATVALVRGLVLDGCLCACHGGRWQGSGEDETGGEGADGVDEFGAAGNVPAHDTVGLSEGAGDDVDALHDCAGGSSGGVGFVVEVLCNTSTGRAVHAYCMDFIEKSEGAVLVGQVADLLNGADGATHGVDRLESDNLGRLGRDRGEFGFQVFHIIMLEDHLLGARVTDSLNHRRVVAAVGKNDTSGKFATQSGKSGIICDITGRKDEGRFLGVQLGNGGLKADGVLVVAGNVTSPTSTSTVSV